jgi:hypothetical protein
MRPHAEQTEQQRKRWACVAAFPRLEERRERVRRDEAQVRGALLTRQRAPRALELKAARRRRRRQRRR